MPFSNARKSRAPKVLGLTAAVFSLALASCSSEADLDVSQAGYDQASECFVTLMGLKAVSQEPGSQMTKGSTKALMAMRSIGVEMGMDDQKLREDSHANTKKVQAIIKLGNDDKGSAEFAAVQAKAKECSAKFGD